MSESTKQSSNEAECGNKSKPLLPAVLIRKQKIQDILRDCVIELDNISGEKPFDFVDVRALLSVMDNAVFYMGAEIRDIEKLNGKWTMLGK